MNESLIWQCVSLILKSWGLSCHLPHWENHTFPHLPIFPSSFHIFFDSYLLGIDYSHYSCLTSIQTKSRRRRPHLFRSHSLFHCFGFHFHLRHNNFLLTNSTLNRVLWLSRGHGPPKDPLGYFSYRLALLSCKTWAWCFLRSGAVRAKRSNQD